MEKVSIVIDWEIPEELVGIFMESTGDQFVGDKRGVRSLKECVNILNGFAKVRRMGDKPLLGITKIYLGDKLVGFSFPRPIMERERKVFKLDVTTEYFRMGTIYIAKEHQGKGIGLAAIKIFTEEFKNILWSCDSLNEDSHKVAIKAGLKFSHQIYVKSDDRSWKFHNFEGADRVNNVYKLEVN